MKIVSDLHIHSKYSRATSKDLSIENLEKWARVKGVNLLGTGDFTFPAWLKDLKSKLIEEEGILKTKTGFNFILQVEISNFYQQDGRLRKIHNVILAPSFEIVEQINELLSKKGDLVYDGRPIFNNYSCIELVDDLMRISKNIAVIPAHCLLPNTLIHSNLGLKPIDELKKGQKVLTHKGRFKEVKEIYTRKYKGIVYRIQPRYFTLGLSTTKEHPFYAIKTLKNCSWTSGICKPSKFHIRRCVTQAFQDYRPSWIPAKDLEVGDVLLYPRLKETKDVKFIIYNNSKIRIDKEFCRLVGYYLAEGYSNRRDGIGFSFNKSENEFVDDVKYLLKHTFNLTAKMGKTKGDIIVYSKNVMRFFEDNFYSGEEKRAYSKSMPHWVLMLPLEKQVEILKCWWYGDKGSTSSRLLCNQMKIICLRLGIIPSIRIDTKESHKLRGKHKIKGRIIKAKRDNFVIGRLSFFEDKFELLKDKHFARCKSKKTIRYGWIDDDYIYLPVFKIEKNYYEGPVYNLEVEGDNSYVSEFATIHNCWTPWFSLFGSNSGFDSIKDCFQDQLKNVLAIETGLSSDPAMNWRLSQLDDVAIVSFSDLHSFWPWRIGREATVFDLDNLTYNNLIKALKEKDKKHLIYTIEVNPSYGKYHFDGHRLCNVSLEPKESLRYKNICPQCGRKLTIGVAHRVEQLADRPEGFVPKNAIPFKTIIPLHELIAAVFRLSQLASEKVWREYNRLIDSFGNELSILLETPFEELKKVTSEKIAQVIMQNREGKMNVKPGYDGVYGELFLDEEEIQAKRTQKSLNQFMK